MLVEVRLYLPAIPSRPKQSERTPRANPHRITVAIRPVPIPSAATRRRLAQLFGRRSIAARGHSGYTLQPQWPECSYLVEVAFALVSVRRAAAERQHAVAVVLVRALGYAARRVELVRVHPRPDDVRRDLPRLNRQLTTADSQRPSAYMSYVSAQRELSARNADQYAVHVAARVR
jgi:hypothetical protein